LTYAWLRRRTGRVGAPGWLLAAGLAAALAGCNDNREGAPGARGAGQPAPPPRQVRTTRVLEKRIERTVIALGSLAAFEQATLSAKVPGRVREIHVDIGSRARRGDVLAAMEPVDYELKVQQAAAALAQARAALGLPLAGESDRIDPESITAVKEARAVLDEASAAHERARSLLKEKLISDSQFDTARSAYLVALNRHQDAIETTRQKQAVAAQRRAELAIARQQLADTTLTAPFDGGVQARQTSVGEYLAVGAPILTLVRLDPLRLRVEVSERDAPQVRVGQALRFRVEGEAVAFSNRVCRLSPALNDNRMLVVEADIPHDERLHPGYFARAEIVTTPDSPALIIPTNAVATFSGIEKAFTIRDGKAVERRIATRDHGADWVEVRSGLAAGEEIILDPGNLQNGHRVAVGPGPAPKVARSDPGTPDRADGQ